MALGTSVSATAWAIAGILVVSAVVLMGYSANLQRDGPHSDCSCPGVRLQAQQLALEHTEATTRHAKEVDLYKSQVTQAAERHATLEGVVTKLQEQVEQLNAKISAITAENAKQLTRTQEIQDECDREINAARSQQQQLEVQVSAGQEDLRIAERQLQEASTQCKRDMELLRIQVQDAEALAKQHEEDGAQIQQQVDALHQELSDIQTAAALGTDREGKLRDELRSCQRRHTNLQVDIAAFTAGQQEMLTRAATVMDRPDIAAMLVSAWDTLEPAVNLPEQYQPLWQTISACAQQVDYQHLPDIDDLTKGRCSPVYVPWRRYSSYAKLAYCIGKLDGVQTYMDAFMSHAGTAVLTAQGMIDASKHDTIVTGWEIDPGVIAKVQTLIEPRFPNIKMRGVSTLEAGSVKFNSTSMRLIDAKGDMVDWCHENRVDVGLVDGGWGTIFQIKGEDAEMAEAIVGYEICRPKYLLQVSSNYHKTTKLVRDLAVQRGEYQPVVTGFSRGTACGKSLTERRTIELLVRVDKEDHAASV